MDCGRSSFNHPQPSFATSTRLVDTPIDDESHTTLVGKVIPYPLQED
jgi:hypothetical protein